VGARSHEVGSNAYQGAAYIYTYANGTWTQTAELTASDGAADDYFGGSVSLSGNTALVGALGREVGSNAFQGAAYIYTDSNGTWTQTAELTASDGAAWDSFGGSVSLSGNTALVGASGHEVGSNAQQGAAYVFASPPTVTGISPSSGSIAGGTVVTITGTNFVIGGTTANFGTTAVTADCSSTTTCTVITPAATTAGTLDITMTTPSGSSATTAVDQFAYTSSSGTASPGSSSSPSSSSSTTTLKAPDTGLRLTSSYSALPLLSSLVVAGGFLVLTRKLKH